MTTTLEEFTTALDKAFASVSQEDLNKLLASWGENEESVKARLKEQFNSWPDGFKGFDDPKDIINVRIDKNSVGCHQFLSVRNYKAPAGMDLSNIDLRDVNLSLFTLTGVNLRGADLRGANLYCADMDDTNLHGARLEGARLFGVDLKGAKGTVTIDHGTKLPSELLRLYFDPEFYQYDAANRGFVNKPTTFDDFKTRFIRVINCISQHTYPSDTRLTPPGSTLRIKVSGDINAWVVAMLPDLENAWYERETKREAAIQAEEAEATRQAAIEAAREAVRREDNEFMASLKAQGQFGRI